MSGLNPFLGFSSCLTAAADDCTDKLVIDNAESLDSLGDCSAVQLLVSDGINCEFVTYYGERDGDTICVKRAQNNTSARPWTVGTKVVFKWTKFNINQHIETAALEDIKDKVAELCAFMESLGDANFTSMEAVCAKLDEVLANYFTRDQDNALNENLQNQITTLAEQIADLQMQLDECDCTGSGGSSTTAPTVSESFETLNEPICPQVQTTTVTNPDGVSFCVEATGNGQVFVSIDGTPITDLTNFAVPDGGQLSIELNGADGENVVGGVSVSWLDDSGSKQALSGFSYDVTCPEDSGPPDPLPGETTAFCYRGRRRLIPDIGASGIGPDAEFPDSLFQPDPLIACGGATVITHMYAEGTQASTSTQKFVIEGTGLDNLYSVAFTLPGNTVTVFSQASLVTPTKIEFDVGLDFTSAEWLNLLSWFQLNNNSILCDGIVTCKA